MDERTVDWQSAEEVVRAYYRHLNADEVDSMLALMHPDAQLVATGTRARTGTVEIADFLRRALAPYAAHHDSVTRTIVADDTVVAELEFTGSLADGTKVAFDSLTVFDLADGQIVRVSNWYDTQGVRRMLAGART